MKKEIKLQLYIHLFLGACILLGEYLSKNMIEKTGTTFAVVFWATFAGLVVSTLISLCMKWYSLRKKVRFVSDANERTLENMKTSLLWSYIGTVIIASIGIFILLFIHVQAIEIEWLLYGVIIVWIAVIGSLFIGKKM